MKNLLLILALAVILVSCGEDKVIDDTDNGIEILLATGGSEPKLQIYSFPEMNVLNPDVMQEINQEDIPGAISKIKLERGMLFLVMPDVFKILVLNYNTYEKVGLIDFSAEQLRPADISFPNATDAYVAHPDTNFVTLVDLTVFQPARKIETGSGPESITVYGNQIYVTNRRANTISVVDSRTREEVREISVVANPVMGDIAADGEDAVIISAGSGKYGAAGPKGDLHVYFVNTSNSLLREEHPITLRTINLNESTPVSMLTTPKDWAFVATDHEFFKIDTREESEAFYINARTYSNLVYDFYRKQIIMIEDFKGSKYIVTADEGSGRQISSGKAPETTTAVYPL